MEPEKIIRIVAVFFVVAAFAVKIATYWLFPDAPRMLDLPVLILLILSIGSIWRNTTKKTNTHK